MTDIVVTKLFNDGDKCLYPISESNGKTYYIIVKITNVKEYGERQADGTYKIYYNATVYSQVAQSIPATIMVEENKLITLVNFSAKVTAF